MRHIWSLIAGIVAAPVIWFSIALGNGAPHSGGWMLLGVGVLAGLIATLRTSPLGAIVVGLAFAGASVAEFLPHAGSTSRFATNWTLGDYRVDLASPVTSGMLAVIGGLMLVSVFSAARWRSRPSTVDASAPPVAESDETWSPIGPERTPRQPVWTDSLDPQPQPQQWAPEEQPSWQARHGAPEPEEWSATTTQDTSFTRR